MTQPLAYFSYFPQFHPDPLNDRAWGTGFTDWDLIRKLDDGTRERFLPARGCYDPSHPDHLPQLESDLAAFEVPAGLMVYHYHFDGVYALSGFERQLLAQRSGLPFFFCWANETWTKRWVGLPKDVIVEQRHLPDETTVRQHVDHLVRFFDLPGYRRHRGRPLFVIYNPLAHPDLPKSLALYRKCFAERGHQPLIGACLSHPQPPEFMAPYDFACEFEPRMFFNVMGSRRTARLGARIKARFPAFFEWLGAKRDLLRKASGSREFRYQDYLRAAGDGRLESALRESAAGKPLMRSTFLTWDNLPRYGARNTLVSHEGIDEAALLALTTRLTSDEGLPLLVNSWNEWSEGAALEPGQRPHHLRSAFLGALRQLPHTA